jgi:lipopolysaccharide/colanic/teichoic acid biosynthesis glycosyltransferase
VSPETKPTRRSTSSRSMRALRELRLRDAALNRALHRPSTEPEAIEATSGGLPPDPGALTALNVVVAIVLLVFAAPLMAVVALLVRLTSRGPVLFAQERVGLDRRTGFSTDGERRRADLGGRPVRIYKFRTMYFDGRSTRQVWTRPNDARVTRVGRLLRSYRIDEFPQLLNVLKREMNVVGPRPEQVQIFAQLRERHERFPDRQRVLPGITGLAQVKCGYGGDDFLIRRKLECDLEYVERRDLKMDLEILLRTIPVVLTRRGAR